MKLYSSILAALAVTGTALWPRIAVMGFEQAVLSTLTEWLVTSAGARREKSH
ncbi:MAG TPA: hypothetical protein VNO43_16690 [Candidatus Eisenbacteria bacterium]|nr:hypothetical protein [Candidatus Eisenbacteria bacterium]